MSALNAFLTTWSQARATFGDGTPTDGTDFDQSARVGDVQRHVAAAAPNASWSGAASQAYAERNTKQADELSRFGDLDRRIGTELRNSAAVVAAGRNNLDAVRKWVFDAAATVPNTVAGQRLLLPLISRGVEDMQSIVLKSNTSIAEIADRIRWLGNGYDELGRDQPKRGDATTSWDDDENEGPDGSLDDLPDTTFDIRDIVYTKTPLDINDPDTLAPRGYMELVPGTGVWVPNPRSPYYKPTPVEAPLGIEDVHYYGEGVMGLPWEMELYPGSGVWIPDPDYPAYQPSVPKDPIDLAEVDIVDPTALIPWGRIELWPRAGVIIPDPYFNGPH